MSVAGSFTCAAAIVISLRLTVPWMPRHLLTNSPQTGASSLILTAIGSRSSAALISPASYCVIVDVGPSRATWLPLWIRLDSGLKNDALNADEASFGSLKNTWHAD